ncbi:MAG: pantoate--beta-alanine ligase [Oceanospirillales bacterium LUC14_002_19_P2]|nr:MAG: pantoate--beta-alanine ligase [Oceanospirillales bacterium LUC14_002_19_P2]
MKTVYSINDTRDYIRSARAQGRSIAFVPTMGNLHDGHLSLVKKAKEQADEVVVSIYVNQLQFGPNEDYDSYPRTFEEDQALLEAHDVQLVFAPSSHEIYPEGAEHHTVVRVDALDGMHCGKSRPGFITGIATVVTKLFNIVQSDYAVFGEKDFQQLCIIRKMVNDLMLPVEIIGAPIARAENGLALSSRNGYLSAEEKQTAATLHQTLSAARESIIAGDRNYDALHRDAFVKLARAGFKPDYFNIVSRHTLQPATLADKELVILAAAALGRARLIDNIQIDL